MFKKRFFEIIFIIILSGAIGLLYNYISKNPLPLIRPVHEELLVSDSVLVELLKQDSLSKSADSLKKPDQGVVDSLKLLEAGRTKDSLKLIKKHKEDSLKSAGKDTVTIKNVKPVDIKLDFAKLMFDKGYAFIDARDEKDYVQGHIQGAINIPFHDFEKSKSKLTGFKKDRVLILYCSSGCDVSIDLAYAMIKEGFTKLYVFRGGWDEWKAAGYPAN